MLFESSGTETTLKNSLDQMCAAAEKAVDEGKNYIILSDRGISKDKAPVPSLLAVFRCSSSPY
jgi:glutamate synthase (NADPH) large chain